jgi:hypothetical protein
MTRKPAASTEARDLRSLLEAVRSAVAIDYDTPDYDRRMSDRLSLVRVVVGSVLDDPGENIGWNADWLRSKLRAEETEAAEKAVRRSVDAQYPAIAAFLADDRGERR